ncbi:hypothetical protein DB30_07112 [Enhygromyxa salina]|uniref:DUF3105 domain-containing protein n=1 Tax=Enhygromyxa salina TaxID=215803 RepID=A0A0C2CSG1_9BACT|nr:DUF3105 domain-containing protein [Enhygromyxa salina]KIG14116.1 hypothetical protein DB30_07112 [Enhygromyxa salina]
MLRTNLQACLLAGLSCCAWACIGDDLADTGTGESNSTQSTAPEDTTGDGDGDVCNTAETTTVEACPAIIGEGFCSEGGIHVDQDSAIDWGNNPPHSGDHYPTWEKWGEHDTPVPRGNWVHNMEHGGIVLVYNCPDGCDAELDTLRMVLDMRTDSRILITEDPLLDGPPFAAVSWTWVHEFDTPVLDELLCFVDQHFNHAPENVP